MLPYYCMQFCFAFLQSPFSQPSHTCHPKSEATMLVCHHDVSGSHTGASTGVVAFIRGTYFQTYILVVIVVIVPLTALPCSTFCLLANDPIFGRNFQA